MEIFRAWGLEESIRKVAADVEPLGWLTPSLASGEGRVMALGYPTVAEAKEISPTRPAWAPQDHLEPLLLDLLGSLPTVELRFGCELVGLQQAEDRVVASVRASCSTPDAADEDLAVGVGLDVASTCGAYVPHISPACIEVLCTLVQQDGVGGSGGGRADDGDARPSAASGGSGCGWRCCYD